MVEGSLYVALAEKRTKSHLRTFKYLTDCFVKQELSWICVDTTDSIRSNSRKYQGNPSKAELLHHQNCSQMD